MLRASLRILIDISNYCEGHFSFRGFRISDSYVAPRNGNHGEYSIVIESSPIRNDQDLYKAIARIKILAQRITVLAKCILGVALNTSGKYYNSFSIVAEQIDEMPPGWESNYNEIKECLDRDKPLRVRFTLIPEHYYQLKESPLRELRIAVRSYSRLKQPIKDILVFINDADLASHTSRYILLAKALEIVDSLYPFNHRGNDDRIARCFPEIVSFFNGVTIKDLMNLSNNRVETRHYIKDKSSTKPHPQMTGKEAIDLYRYVNLLCVNIVRKELGLCFKKCV